MSVHQVSSVPFSIQNLSTKITRRSANFHPSIWGDHFLSYASNSMEMDHDKLALVQKLKEEIRRMLMVPVEVHTKKLEFIDAIQRLGVSYHFEKEIDNVLQQIYVSETDNHDLYYVALRFRVLRQQCYKISCDVFNKFVDKEGKFKNSLTTDVQGMLSLYEASHLRIHGENELNEALAFTTSHLKSIVTQLNPHLAAQKQHQKELSEISRWWKDLEFSKKLPFERDRVVECYFWSMGVYFEPVYYMARRIMTKVTAMISTMDDIYDVYGTLEELELFTDAVECWDTAAIDELPEYMKHAFRALLDVYAEIEEKMVSEGRSYRVFYAREAMKNQIRAYFHEAKWCHEQYIPTMEEYMSIALVSSAFPILVLTSLVGMDDIVTKETFEWLFRDPKMVKVSAVIGRLMNDIVSHKFEQNRDHVASAVECYMKQHGSTEQEAVIEFHKQVADAWKDINEACLYPSSFPMKILTRVVNLARVSDVIYKDEDGYTHAEVVLKDYIASLFIDPVQI
ncbi:(-)-germacrene D synthase [Quillaja saponaria]|uniref:(-)-germacrene D synthase n=1 Tax=Quillaja saponaria TaxID=32244 RepID=A0AAD7QIZ3_QUISA|nr:(-)-germacrene D synthase [Quillaja saponaria]